MSKNELIMSLYFMNYWWREKTTWSHVYGRSYCWRLSPRPGLKL